MGFLTWYHNARSRRIHLRIPKILKFTIKLWKNMLYLPFFVKIYTRKRNKFENQKYALDFFFEFYIHPKTFKNSGPICRKYPLRATTP
jgi:hypothetical protein